MSFSINQKPWFCPECSSTLDLEECEQIGKMLADGHDQIEFRCEPCGEQLTADTSDCPEGEVSLNADWVYD